MRVALVLLAAALLAPLVAAHVPHTRPPLQASEAPRQVETSLNGTVATFDLYDQSDRLRHYVRHVVAPGRMSFEVQMRDDASVAEGAIQARWELARLLLFRDANADGAYQPGTDSVLKSWRFQSYVWKTTGVKPVRVGTASNADDVLWNGSLAGAPNVTLEVVASGRDVTDEGARARPQDALAYLTFPDLPPRPTGTLYAIEGTLVAAEGASVTVDTAQNLTMGIHVDDVAKRAYLDWGGEATVDGHEGAMTLGLDDPTVANGQQSRPFRWSFPVLDKSIRVVFVSAVEFTPTTSRGVPGFELPLAAAALVALALARRR